MGWLCGVEMPHYVDNCFVLILFCFVSVALVTPYDFGFLGRAEVWKELNPISPRPIPLYSFSRAWLSTPAAR